MKPIRDRLAVMTLGIIIIVYGLISPVKALTSLARAMEDRGYHD
jgi:hypothetical protein